MPGRCSTSWRGRIASSWWTPRAAGRPEPWSAWRPTPARSTHGLGLADAIGLAAELGVLTGAVSLYVVHGLSFEPGPVTPEVAAGARTAAELVLRDELGIEVGGRPRPR